MSAGEVLRTAVATALRARPEFAGVDGLVRDTAPNSLPQARVEAAAADWSVKGRAGRELRLTTTIRVSRGQEMRLPMMIAAAESVGSALGGTIDGWQIGSAVLTASRSAAMTDGTRRATIEHRVRMLAAS